MNKTNL